MTEPTPDPAPTPPPRPFRPETATAAPWHLDRRAVIGCGAGCLVLLGLFAALIVALGLRGGSLLGVALTMSQDALRSEAPEDWSEQDQQAMDAAFERAGTALTAGEAELEELETVQRALVECLGSAGQGNLRREQLERLRRALEALASDRSSILPPAPVVPAAC